METKEIVMVRKLGKENERASKLANELLYAFPWEGTREGSDYWYAVYARLLRIAEEGY